MRLGRSKGCRIVGCNFSVANAFFVRDDIAGSHFLEPATSEEHDEPPRYFFPMPKGGMRRGPGHTSRLESRSAILPFRVALLDEG